jgi:hypothetical protein
MATHKRKDKFPLWLHPTGQWGKKINGRYCYFGTDRAKALAEYVRVREDLEAGRKPRPKDDESRAVPGAPRASATMTPSNELTKRLAQAAKLRVLRVGPQDSPHRHKIHRGGRPTPFLSPFLVTSIASPRYPHHTPSPHATLDHCGGPGPHVRGCWVVDLLLGKK